MHIKESEKMNLQCSTMTETLTLLHCSERELDVRDTLSACVTVSVWEISSFLSLLLKIDYLSDNCLQISEFHINEKITADISLPVWCSDQKSVCENRSVHFNLYLISLCVWILFCSVRVTADNINITHYITEKDREDSIDTLKSIQTAEIYLRHL